MFQLQILVLEKPSPELPRVKALLEQAMTMAQRSTAAAAAASAGDAPAAGGAAAAARAAAGAPAAAGAFAPAPPAGTAAGVLSSSMFLNGWCCQHVRLLAEHGALLWWQHRICMCLQALAISFELVQNTVTLCMIASCMAGASVLFS